MRKSWILLAAIIWFSCQPPKSEETIKDLKEEILSLTNTVDGDFGIAFRLLEDPHEELFIHEKEVFHAASTMKTPVMIEVFKQAEAGNFDLEDSILIVNEFTSIVDGSTFSMDLGVDSQEGLYEMIGEKTTIYELMYQMIIKSSNLATNIVIDLVGAENVTRTMRALGARDIQVLRGVEDLKAFDAGLSNTTTAFDMMLIMEAIAKGKAVSQEADARMVEILTDQYYNDMIPQLLPKNVKVAHKTGSISGVQHDAAILVLPDGTSYVLVILTKNLADVTTGKQTIAEISSLIYEFVLSGQE